MNKCIRRVLELVISIGGSLLAFYIGGYLLFLRPIFALYDAFITGTLTGQFLFVKIVEIALASTVAGALWCLFDIIAGLFRDREDDSSND